MCEANETGIIHRCNSRHVVSVICACHVSKHQQLKVARQTSQLAQHICRVKAIAIATYMLDGEKLSWQTTIGIAICMPKVSIE